MLAKRKNNKQRETVTHKIGAMFANLLSNKGLISRIYKDLIKLNSESKTHVRNSVCKWAKSLSKHCPQKRK